MFDKVEDIENAVNMQTDLDQFIQWSRNIIVIMMAVDIIYCSQI